MKRIRDDIDASRSQDKRPRGTPQSESNGQGINPTADAILFLKAVKATFHDEIHKYRMFLEILKAWKANRMDTSDVISRVKELFKGHKNLILEFNTWIRYDS